MSYHPKRPFDTSRAKMITRQQCSDLLSYGSIVTKLRCARSTQIFAEKLLTSSKIDNLNTRRKAYSILLRTKKYTRSELVSKLFAELAHKYRSRKGGYTRLLRLSDEKVLLQLV